ncbi:galactoside O-acetyltransferase [Flexibacter flexilis DSM 6793]|uniref:Galactoside O-acetyltransferase n=1 Tax=Flexibacter flexilis DSM 6793 TaxID=927664 RepID=A0A1I1DKI4_9BACT|nr:acyltransferase [Flexibacter flexilis]SFB75475.1 galactoside O-acetyltransferase [Flexibacter flexilis DSM 6793]
MGFLSQIQLEALNFRHLGKNVLISDKASIYNAANISIGDNSRIDDFCVISAGADGISIGRYVHIACYSSLIGKARIEMHDFSGLSSKVSIYSSSDDYSGNYLTNPTVPSEFSNVIHKPVVLKKHVIVGASAVILPGVTAEEGVAIGAFALVVKNCDAFSIYGGIPARKVKERSVQLLDLEQKLAEKYNL